MQTQCIVAEEVNRVRWGRYSIRDPQPDELLVQTLYSAVSPGTELRCLAGREPNAGAFPMITGYSLVGRVIQGAGGIAEGTHVFLNGASVVPEGISRSWGGHIGLAIAPPTAGKVLPDGIDLKSASALSMLAIAMHGVCRANPQPGDCVLVVGMGLIGQLAAAILQATGCRLAACDPLPHRLELASKMGCANMYPSTDGWHDQIRRDFPHGFDVVVDVTGVPSVVEANLPLLREKSWSNPYEPSPKLVLLGSYSGKICLDYQDTLFNKETQILTCRTYLPHELDAAVKVLANGQVRLNAILSEEFPAAQAPDVFQRLREDRDRYLTAVFNWTREA